MCFTAALKRENTGVVDTNVELIALMIFDGVRIYSICFELRCLFQEVKLSLGGRLTSELVLMDFHHLCLYFGILVQKKFEFRDISSDVFFGIVVA